MDTALLWPDDDSEDVVVVTDTNESVEEDGVTDEVDTELFVDDEVDELSVSLCNNALPSFAKVSATLFPFESMRSTYKWWPYERKKSNQPL